MALRNGHGKGAGVPRLEVLPADELPKGVAALQPSLAALPRPPYAKGSAEAQEAGRRGGKAKAGTTALASGLGLAKTFADPSLEPYRCAAENFARLHINRLSQTVGGGVIEPGWSSVVWSAAFQLAGSRWAFEVKGDVSLGSKLANDSRQNLLAAHELAARMASARTKPDLTSLIAAASRPRGAE